MLHTEVETDLLKITFHKVQEGRAAHLVLFTLSIRSWTWTVRSGSITGQLVSLPGFLAFILVLSEKHWAKQWAENREPVLLPNFIQSICFQMRNCPHTMPEGGEG